MASDIDRAYVEKTTVEAEFTPERISVLTLFKEYVNLLGQEGFEVIGNSTGNFQGAFSVYRKGYTRASIGKSIAGLSGLPEGHISQLPINSNDSGWEQAVTDVADKLQNAYCEQKEAKRIIDGLELTFSGLSNTFSGFNIQRYYATRNDAGAVTTLDGGQLAHKVVPKLDWFDERIQSINPEDLLRHFSGEAERKLFMLWLGRVVSGNRNSNIVEFFGKGLDTGCRLLAILVGEAGNGKSFTLGILGEVLKSLGFGTASVPEMSARFGWDKTSSADFSSCSDLSAGSFKQLVCDSIGTTKILQIVTGDTIDADVKNVSSVEVQPKAALGFATNEVPVEAQIAPNEGMVSRVCLLSTVTKIELGQRWGLAPMNAKEAWENILESLGIEPTQEWLRCLMAYLLRKSLDYYLETAGYSYELGSLVKSNRKVSLEKIIEELKQGTKEKLECAHKYEIPDLAIRGLALAVVAAKNASIDLEEVKRLAWSWRNVELLWNTWKQAKVFMVDKPEYDLPSMARSHDGRANVIENAFRGCLADTKEPNAKHMELMSFFNTDSGIGYPRRVSAYAKLWDTKLGDFDYYLAEVERDVADGTIPKGYLNQAKTWLHTVMNGDW